MSAWGAICAAEIAVMADQGAFHQRRLEIRAEQ
jgi:hypothetical protein